LTFFAIIAVSSSPHRTFPTLPNCQPFTQSLDSFSPRTQHAYPCSCVFNLYKLLSTSPQNLPESPLKLYGVLEETAYLDPLERLSDYFLNARRVWLTHCHCVPLIKECTNGVVRGKVSFHLLRHGARLVSSSLRGYAAALLASSVRDMSPALQ
jgi:hypothetical protein